MGKEATTRITGDGILVSKQDVGRVLREQRRRIGLSQGDIAKKMGYVNINFISMIESGKSKIPVNRVEALVAAYELPSEFMLVILRSSYPDALSMIFMLAKKVPKLFKEAVKNPEGEILDMYQGFRMKLKIA